MTEQLRQSLSAAMDDEADAFELRRVLDELDRSPELRATWDRYHLIGSVLRGEGTGLGRSADAGGSRSTAAPCWAQRADVTGDSEAEIGAADGLAGRRAGRHRVGFGLAVAASVLLAVAVVWQPVTEQEVATTTTTDVATAAPVLPDILPEELPVRVSAETRGWVPVSETTRFDRGPLLNDRRAVSRAEQQRRAHAYMIQHAQQQGLEQQSVISLVKMASYESP